jgi:ribonucleoside-triphosphate reductase
MKPSDVRSMCCRLRLDLRELLKKGNGLFGSAEQTGSIGVVTLNMARLGYLHKGDKQALLDHVKYLCEVAKDSLEVKRDFLTDRLEAGFYPFTKRWIGTYRNFFSTIGVNGMNEMILNFTDGAYDITTDYGQAMAEEVLDYIRDLMVEFQKITGHLYNLEATPAEGATTRFARADKKLFADIIQAGTEDAPYYTNSSQLPVNYTTDPFEALEKQDRLQTKYTGGTVLHLYMGQKISSGEACKAFVKNVLTNYNLPYISITPVYSICPKHGYIAGEHKFCPICAHEFEAERLINLNK